MYTTCLRRVEGGEKWKEKTRSEIHMWMNINLPQSVSDPRPPLLAEIGVFGSLASFLGPLGILDLLFLLELLDSLIVY